MYLHKKKSAIINSIQTYVNIPQPCNTVCIIATKEIDFIGSMLVFLPNSLAEDSRRLLTAIKVGKLPLRPESY